MSIKDIITRLDRYQDRLNEGKAAEIKTHHIEKAIEKLSAKESQLTEELSAATKPDKRARLEGKIETIRDQIRKAKWLAKEL